MKISVIITCYNREETIGRCIESVLNQDYPDFQVIVVDDGSADGSPAIIHRLEAAFLSRMKVITQKNSGVAAARNAGLAAADGDYVTYLDSDDYMAEGALTAMAAATEDGVMDQVLYDALMIFENGDRQYYGAFHDGAALGAKEGKLIPSRLLLSNPCPWNRLVRRELYTRVFGSRNPFPEGLWYEDLATIPLLAVSSEHINYVKKPLIYYCQSEGSIMRHCGYNPHYEDIFTVADRLRKALNFAFPEETEYLIWDHLLISAGKRYLACRRKKSMKECGAYMEKYYPDWTGNRYVKQEPAKKRTLARLISEGRYFTLKLLGK